jgi:hypothetical protein
MSEWISQVKLELKSNFKDLGIQISRIWRALLFRNYIVLETPNKLSLFSKYLKVRNERGIYDTSNLPRSYSNKFLSNSSIILFLNWTNVYNYISFPFPSNALEFYVVEWRKGFIYPVQWTRDTYFVGGARAWYTHALTCTVHRPGDGPRKECEECGNARGSNVRYYPTWKHSPLKDYW